MDKEKQIEELARALRFDGKDCESTQCLLCHNSKHCFERKLAEEVISKGYRKASEVAEEIFEEIGKTLHHWGSLAEQDHTDYGELMELVVGDVISNIAELKKKYESEKDNDR